MRYVIFLVDADKLFDIALGINELSVRSIPSNKLMPIFTRLHRILGTTSHFCGSFVRWINITNASESTILLNVTKWISRISIRRDLIDPMKL